MSWWCCGRKETNENLAASGEESQSKTPAVDLTPDAVIAVQPPPGDPGHSPKTTPASTPSASSDDNTVTARELNKHVIPEELNIITPGGAMAPTKAAVAGGGVQLGKFELCKEAYIIKGLSDTHARHARKSMKKDKSGNKFDGKRKEYVFDYLNTEGGWIIDPADKSKFVKVEPGSLM